MHWLLEILTKLCFNHYMGVKKKSDKTLLPRRNSPRLTIILSNFTQTSQSALPTAPIKGRRVWASADFAAQCGHRALRCSFVEPCVGYDDHIVS